MGTDIQVDISENIFAFTAIFFGNLLEKRLKALSEGYLEDLPSNPKKFLVWTTQYRTYIGRDETGRVYMPTQQERTLQFCTWW